MFRGQEVKSARVTIPFLCLAGGIFLGGCLSPQDPADAFEFVVFNGAIGNGLDLGIASSSGRTDWVDITGGEIRLHYPSGESWGSAFLVAGVVAPGPPHPDLDMSAFSCLELVLRSDAVRSEVHVGVKSSLAPDTQATSTYVLEVGQSWEHHIINLSAWDDAELSHLYVLTSLELQAHNAVNLYCKEIRFVR